LFVPGKALGDTIFEWCRRNAALWQIQRVIWYKQIWQGSRPNIVTPYCVSRRTGEWICPPRDPHRDHLHIEQNNRGAATGRNA
jgi:hypothetical protein